MSSFEAPEDRLELVVLLEELVDDGLLDVGLLGGVPGCALSLLGLLEVLELLLDALPNFAFFNTKLSPPALLELALLDGLALDVSLLDAPARCRQPVALATLALAPVDDCGGVDVVGLCAASVPHSATTVLSVTAHCE